MSIEEAREYIDQIIQQFDKETDVFRGFFSAFRLLRYRIDNENDLCDKVHVLFKGRPELIQGIHNFFPEHHKCGALAGRSGTPPSSQLPSSEPLFESNGGCDTKRKKKNVQRPKLDRNLEKKECVDFVNRVMRSLEDDEKRKEFFDQIRDYQKHKNIDVLDKKFLLMFKDMPELHILFTRFRVSRSEEENLLEKQRRNSYQTNYYYNGEEDDLSLLKKELFICEDKMYDADVILDLLKSTKEAVKRYLKYKRRIETGGTAAEEEEEEEEKEKEKEENVEDEFLRVPPYMPINYVEEEFFQQPHKRQIRQLYGKELGEEMLDQLLNKQPIIAGERILKRLEKKLEECTIWRNKKEEIFKKDFVVKYKNVMNYTPPPEKKRRRR